MAKRNNTIDTLLVQLEALCTTLEQRRRIQQISAEIKIQKDISAKNISNKELYATLHITRGLDSSLRLFLEINNVLGTEHSLGDYLKRLTNHRSANIARLKEDLRTRFQRDIVDKRNLYMHSSGQFPNKNEMNEIESQIYNCLQTVLLLKH